MLTNGYVRYDIDCEGFNKFESEFYISVWVKWAISLRFVQPYKMNRIYLIFFLLFGCNQAATYKKVFEINEDYLKIDLKSIRTIEQFDDFYCEGNKNFPLILPYDFEDGRLDYSSNFGIPAIGHPMRCHPANCCKYAVSILVKDEFTWLYDYDIEIDRKGLDSLIRLNILNYGYFPSLSDNPDDALFIIRADGKTLLSDLNLILAEISNTYLDILEDEFPELGKSDDTEIYPLNLIITTFVETPPIPVDSTLYDEIEEEIKIDMKGST